LKHQVCAASDADSRRAERATRASAGVTRSRRTIQLQEVSHVPYHHYPQTIFKCVDLAGKVEYRNSACPSGTEAEMVDTQVAAGNVLDIRRNSDQRREIETRTVIERPALPARAPQPPAPVNALPPPPEPAEARR
jgi:hypothetical protein